MAPNNKKLRDFLLVVGFIVLVVVALMFADHNDRQFLNEYMGEYKPHPQYAHTHIPVIYAIPDEILTCLPDDELTTAVLHLRDGKLDCTKHVSVPDSQRLARIRAAYPIKHSE